MKAFEFATAQRIIYGRDQLASIRSFATHLGGKTLVVCGTSKRIVPTLLEHLQSEGVRDHVFTVPDEPTVDRVVEGSQAVIREGCHSVVSIGGGSAIDAGKAIAALAANPGDPLNYLEVIGKGQAIDHTPLPFVAIPTTAGTGAEVTRNAVLASPAHRVKVSLRSPRMLPDLAIVDPSLTDSLPRQLTANAGLDALTQLIEPFISCRANPLTDALCRGAIPMAAEALDALSQSLDNPQARDQLAYAALCSGLALANAGSGAVHGFAGPLGGMYSAPHGAVCARLLPFVLKANHTALKNRAKSEGSLQRMNELGSLMTRQPDANATDAIEIVEKLTRDFDIAPLQTYGIQSTEIPSIVEKAQRASSMKGNPIPLQDTELIGILEAAI